MSDGRLSQLLRLKAAEKPSPEFWERFDAEMERKCLRELCGRPSPVRPLRIRLCPGRKGLSFFPILTAGLALVALGLLRWPSAPLAEVSVAMAPDTFARKYIRDAVERPHAIRSSGRDAMHLGRSGAVRYVCDPLAHAPAGSAGSASGAVCF